MNSITFIKDKTEKNTLKDFQMVMEKEEAGKETGFFDFVMRYNSIPTSYRINQLREFLQGEVEAYISTAPDKKFKAKWVVETPVETIISSVGARVRLSYEVVNKVKTEKNNFVKEKVKEEIPEVKKEMPKEIKKEKVKINKEITIEGVE